MRFEIELSNYREIERLFFDDKEKFAKILRTVLEQTNKALKDKRFDQAEKIYNMDYLDMLQQLSNAFFNKEGIINRHQNDAEKEGLRGLAENIHPLAIFTNDIPVYNANGEDVSPYKWIEQGDFNLENWLYSLFYGARFVSWDELAEYLMLGEYELMDVLKAHNFPSLATIQPALQFQKENNIPVGKLIPGTGLFDGGDEATKNHDKCPACENVWNTGHSKYGYCNKCRLGGLK